MLLSLRRVMMFDDTGCFATSLPKLEESVSMPEARPAVFEILGFRVQGLGFRVQGLGLGV